MKITREEAEKFLKEKVFKLEDPDSISFGLGYLGKLEYKSVAGVNIQRGKFVVIEGSLRETTNSEIVGISITYMSGVHRNFRYEECCLLGINKININYSKLSNKEKLKLASIERANFDSSRDFDYNFLVAKISEDEMVAFYIK